MQKLVPVVAAILFATFIPSPANAARWEVHIPPGCDGLSLCAWLIGPVWHDSKQLSSTNVVNTTKGSQTTYFPPICSTQQVHNTSWIPRAKTVQVCSQPTQISLPACSKGRFVRQLSWEVQAWEKRKYGAVDTLSSPMPPKYSYTVIETALAAMKYSIQNKLINVERIASCR